MSKINDFPMKINYLTKIFSSSNVV